MGMLTISFLDEWSIISRALGLVGSLFINPFDSKRLRWPWTDEVDLNPTASQISLTEGGYPLLSVKVFKNS